MTPYRAFVLDQVRSLLRVDSDAKLLPCARPHQHSRGKRQAVHYVGVQAGQTLVWHLLCHARGISRPYGVLRNFRQGQGHDADFGVATQG